MEERMEGGRVRGRNGGKRDRSYKEWMDVRR
jgi:hypothetical protein